MDLREIGWGSIDWIHLAQDRDQLLAHVNTDEQGPDFDDLKISENDL
jgi:hypothetical protein